MRPAVPDHEATMISGVHALIYARDAVRAREFLRDVLGLEGVDAGEGWLIFALPPAELAVHPGDEVDRQELYLMCDDVEATVSRLKAKGVDFTQPVTDRGWGLLTRMRIPGGGELALYQPKHASPLRPRS